MDKYIEINDCIINLSNLSVIQLYYNTCYKIDFKYIDGRILTIGNYESKDDIKEKYQEIRKIFLRSE